MERTLHSPLELENETLIKANVECAKKRDDLLQKLNKVKDDRSALLVFLVDCRHLMGKKTWSILKQKKKHEAALKLINKHL